MNDWRAILFYGSSPGTGKSALSSFLFEQLTLHRMAVLWVYEDDVLSIPYFAQFVDEILSGNPGMVDSLLRATAELVQEVLNSGAILITDSIYPCVNWLIATNLYSHGEIAGVGAKLEELLAPLNPTVIFLKADPKAALERAIAHRGEPWFDDILGALNSYAVNQQRPLASLEEMAAYFQVQADLSLELLRRWSSDLLIIDAMETPLAVAKSRILSHLALDEIETSSAGCLEEWARHVGAYRAKGDVPTTNPLSITVKEGRLWVNSYWPNGCPLLLEGDGSFRLENTSHRIRFEERIEENEVENGKHAVLSLIYQQGAVEFCYQKEPFAGDRLMSAE